jgi:hypothetical protein
LTTDNLTVYGEETEAVRVGGVKYSHLSIETGHFYMKHLENDHGEIRAHFRRVAELVELYTAAARTEFGRSARVSTCFLIDDYFDPNTNPTAILDAILGIATECGLRIDYLAREAGCWETPLYVGNHRTERQIPLAEMVASWLVAEPVEATTGSRPPDVASGWLCNGRRSSEDDTTQAMQVAEYRPAEEYGHRNHSIFLDIELWSKKAGKDGEEYTLWSCPFLASIWQLLRLGMVRYQGEVVVEPQPPSESWPESWWEMPTLIQLNPAAAPFAAYRALSILPQSYLTIEHAVRVILDHVNLDQDVARNAIERAAAERITIPREITRRLSHVFVDDVLTGPATARIGRV